jgi:hypothetical protein
MVLIYGYPMKTKEPTLKLTTSRRERAKTALGWIRSLFRPFTFTFLLCLVAALGGSRESDAGELEATWVDNSSNEDGFGIERRAGTTQTYVQIAVVGANVTSYNDTGLARGETYCYRVHSFNAAGSSPYSNEACAVARPDTSSGLVAAMLPSGRSVQIGVPATTFATIINRGSTIATNCGIALLGNIPAIAFFQITDPFTNQLTGAPNTPVDIPAGGAQSYFVRLTPTQAFVPTDVQMSFDCSNTDPAPISSGLNTLLLSASDTPVPDILALAATPTSDGIVNIPGTIGSGVFSVATMNLGSSGSITVSADTGNTILPVNILLCETNPADGQCISGIGSSVTTQINTNATATFGIFVQGNGNVPFGPGANRIFVRFKDSGAVTRGSTSVAVRTQSDNQPHASRWKSTK